MLALFIMGYGIICFIEWNFNPEDWGWVWRFIYGFWIVVVVWATHGVYEDRQKAAKKIEK